MISVRSGFVVVGCVAVGFLTSAGPGVVARAAEPLRWVGVGTAPGAGASVGEASAQSRIAQLEQRLKELEAERQAESASGRTHGNVAEQLDASLARNDELQARNRALAAENQTLTQNHLFERPVRATACPPPDDADAKAQLRYWAERLRAGGSQFRDRLTVSQNAALNVLLRPERELDPQNPWREM
jgi:cell division protein FtsB